MESVIITKVSSPEGKGGKKEEPQEYFFFPFTTSDR